MHPLCVAALLSILSLLAFVGFMDSTVHEMIISLLEEAVHCATALPERLFSHATDRQHQSN